MQRKTKYGVQFVGYSAKVIARKYGREAEYAMLDFFSGATSVRVEGGWVIVPKRTDLAPFLKILPTLATELKDLLRERENVGPLEPRSLSCGPNTVLLLPGTEINSFIRQVTRRFSEIEQVLEQAEEIGLRIKHRPYSEFIEEISRTGICRVEAHGFALLVHGKLIFYPENQVALVRPTTAQSDSFEVLPLDMKSKNDSQFIH
jgi:hypothetical protein